MYKNGNQDRAAAGPQTSIPRARGAAPPASLPAVGGSDGEVQPLAATEPRASSPTKRAEPVPCLVESALGYAGCGWAVFPVHTPVGDGACSCGDAGCEHVGKHPRTGRGFNDATTDPAKIRSWWQQWPDANIDIATGSGSGMWVLDIDAKEDGTSLEALEAEFGHFVGAPSVSTGGNGVHVYFRWSGVPVRCRTGLRTGLDVRGEGGYVIAPPSLHASLKRYQWRSA